MSYNEYSPNDLIQLPRTREKLDEFVAVIAEEYGLPNDDNTYFSIANMILHIDPKVCHATKKYFGEAVMKQQANEVAYKKVEELRKKHEEAQKAKQAEELSEQAK